MSRRPRGDPAPEPPAPHCGSTPSAADPPRDHLAPPADRMAPRWHPGCALL